VRQSDFVKTGIAAITALKNRIPYFVTEERPNSLSFDKVKRLKAHPEFPEWNKCFKTIDTLLMQGLSVCAANVFGEKTRGGNDNSLSLQDKTLDENTKAYLQNARGWNRELKSGGSETEPYRGDTDQLRDYWEKEFRCAEPDRPSNVPYPHSDADFLTKLIGIKHPMRINDIFQAMGKPMKDVITQGLKESSSSSSPGIDGVGNWILKLCPLLPEYWQTLYQLIPIFGTPEGWQHHFLIFIGKKAGVTCNPKDVRPICLFSCAFKLFQTYVKTLLEEQLERAKWYSKGQRARRGRDGVLEASHILQAVIDYASRHGLELYLLFKDVSNAFGNLEWRIILQVMQSMNLDSLLAWMVYQCLINGELENDLIGTIKVTKGSGQGGTLSAELCMMVLDVCVQHIEKECKGANAFGFRVKSADFVDDSANPTNDRKDMVKMCDIIGAFHAWVRMPCNLSVGKTEITAVRMIKNPYEGFVRNPQILNYAFTLNGVVIPYVSQTVGYRHLGSHLLSGFKGWLNGKSTSENAVDQGMLRCEKLDSVEIHPALMLRSVNQIILSVVSPVSSCIGSHFAHLRPLKSRVIQLVRAKLGWGPREGSSETFFIRRADGGGGLIDVEVQFQLNYILRLYTLCKSVDSRHRRIEIARLKLWREAVHGVKVPSDGFGIGGCQIEGADVPRNEGELVMGILKFQKKGTEHTHNRVGNPGIICPAAGERLSDSQRNKLNIWLQTPGGQFCAGITSKYKVYDSKVAPPWLANPETQSMSRPTTLVMTFLREYGIGTDLKKGSAAFYRIQWEFIETPESDDNVGYLKACKGDLFKSRKSLSVYLRSARAWQALDAQSRKNTGLAEKLRPPNFVRSSLSYNWITHPNLDPELWKLHFRILGNAFTTRAKKAAFRKRDDEVESTKWCRLCEKKLVRFVSNERHILCNCQEKGAANLRRLRHNVAVAKVHEYVRRFLKGQTIVYETEPPVRDEQDKLWKVDQSYTCFGTGRKLTMEFGWTWDRRIRQTEREKFRKYQGLYAGAVAGAGAGLETRHMAVVLGVLGAVGVGTEALLANLKWLCTPQGEGAVSGLKTRFLPMSAMVQELFLEAAKWNGQIIGRNSRLEAKRDKKRPMVKAERKEAKSQGRP